jgi:urease accessory protein
MLHDAWRISRGGKLVWADAVRLEGDLERQRTAPFGFGTSVACATLVYAGPDAPQQLGAARRLLGECALPGGATSLDGIMLVRIMADDASRLRAAVIKLIAGIRQAAASLPARLPRVWHC